MAYGYPKEFRILVMSALDSGQSYTQVSETYKISRYTLYRWVKRRHETGSVSCKIRSSVRSYRKLTYENLSSYIENHPDHYLKEIGKALGVSGTAVYHALKKFGISRKKNAPLLRARREKEASISSSNREDRS